MSEFSHNLAILVGIDRYSNGLSPLQTAVGDVRAIAYQLKTDYHYSILQLTNEQATRTELLNLVTTVLPQRVRPNARLLFYFAGHGIALNGDDGPQGYLIPQDAKLGNTQTYLPMPELQAAFDQLPCRHFLAILDCCFAGAFRWSATRKVVADYQDILYQERFDRFVRDSAWQVITSAAHDQTASDALTLRASNRERTNKERTNKEQINREQINREQTSADSSRQNRQHQGRHSPFAAALLEALSGKADIFPAAIADRPAGDGVITATELYLYLRDRVEVMTTAHLQRQTPGLWPLRRSTTKANTSFSLLPTRSTCPPPLRSTSLKIPILG